MPFTPGLQPTAVHLGAPGVIHYDLPRRIDDYVHRTGRTGRFGRHGISVGFANGAQRNVSFDLAKNLAEANGTPPPWLLGTLELPWGWSWAVEALSAYSAVLLGETSMHFFIFTYFYGTLRSTLPNFLFSKCIKSWVRMLGGLGLPPSTIDSWVRYRCGVPWMWLLHVAEISIC